MKKGIVLSAASYPSRIFEDYRILNDPACLGVCPKLSINDAVKQKNRETFVSSFFAFRHRSKVIARVTQNSTNVSLDYFRAYLALAGGCDHAEDKSGSLRINPLLQNMLPIVACPEVTRQPADFASDGRKKSGLQAQTPLHLPVVAYVMFRPDIKRHLRVFHNMK